VDQAVKTNVNGIDTAALSDVAAAVGENPALGMVDINVKTTWLGQTQCETEVTKFALGGETLPRSFSFRTDEPLELLGTNEHPNPQEFLLGSMNGCMAVGYVAGAAMQGITLESLSIEAGGEIDLRGFLGLSDTVKPGYDTIRYTVRIKGDGTPEQFAELHEVVKKTSPNYFNVANPIRLESELVVE
jgi:uncharacterized OsmC-like protein